MATLERRRAGKRNLYLEKPGLEPARGLYLVRYGVRSPSENTHANGSKVEPPNVKT